MTEPSDTALVDSALVYGRIVVGRLSEVFCHQGTWFGSLALLLEGSEGAVEGRIVEFLHFTEAWNAQQKSPNPPDASAFDPFDEILSSDQWAVRGSDGQVIHVIDEAPNFLGGGEISWLERPHA